jgi:DNA-binding NarL/FixJ family response regulator
MTKEQAGDSWRRKFAEAAGGADALDGRLATLTPREEQIARALMDGEPIVELARRIDVNRSRVAAIAQAIPSKMRRHRCTCGAFDSARPLSAFTTSDPRLA